MPEAYPTELRTLGDHLRACRLDRGLLQREVAPMLGVGVTTVNAWETGRDGVQLRYVPAVVKFLGYVPQPPADSPLGERLRALRIARGLRQIALGKMLGIGASIISKLETGGSTEDERVLRAVEGFLRENS